MRTLLPAALLILTLSTPLPAEEPRRHVLGIRLNMSRDQVRRLLEEIGTFAREEKKRQEVWLVRDVHFSHVALGFDKKGKLRYVTAVARKDKDARRIAYSEVANLEQARQTGNPATGNFNYVWDVSAAEGEPRANLMASGRDPRFLDTFSLRRVEE